MHSADSMMLDLKREAFSNLGIAPAMRFFTPTQAFFNFIKERHTQSPDVIFIDVGCGTGETVLELVQHNIPAFGIDPIRRTGGFPAIAKVMGEDYPWTKNVWPIICRPCHDGFAERTIEKSLAAGCSAFYVGLPKNTAHDLSRKLQRRVKLRINKVGQDGERLYWLESK